MHQIRAIPELAVRGWQLATQCQHWRQRGGTLLLACAGGQTGFPVCGSMLVRTGEPVFGSDAVPMASAVQRSADIFGRLSQGLVEEVGCGVAPGTADGGATVLVGAGVWAG
jgi:hypothetical protein